MSSDALGVFEGTAAEEMAGDAGGSEGVAVDVRWKTSNRRDQFCSRFE